LAMILRVGLLDGRKRLLRICRACRDRIIHMAWAGALWGQATGIKCAGSNPLRSRYYVRGRKDSTDTAKARGFLQPDSGQERAPRSVPYRSKFPFVTLPCPEFDPATFNIMSIWHREWRCSNHRHCYPPTLIVKFSGKNIQVKPIGGFISPHPQFQARNGRGRQNFNEYRYCIMVPRNDDLFQPLVSCTKIYSLITQSDCLTCVDLRLGDIPGSNSLLSSRLRHIVGCFLYFIFTAALPQARHLSLMFC
jgi:hypothetical protein